MGNLNGQEYAWASLFAKMDRSVTLQERHSIEILVHNRHMREQIERLPERIAHAILVSQAHAALGGSAGLSGWTHLIKSLTRLVHMGTWALGVLLLVMGRVGWQDLWIALVGSLK